jgi:hypothetical protein
LKACRNRIVTRVSLAQHADAHPAWQKTGFAQQFIAASTSAVPAPTTSAAAARAALSSILIANLFAAGCRDEAG